MADLYEQPKVYVTSGEPMAVPTASTQAGQPSVDQMLSQLSPEEREEAMQFITAPPTGEEISNLIQEKNANGEVHEITREQYRLLKSHLKTQESDLISMLGEAGSKVFEDIQAAATAAYDKPDEALKKLTPSVIEAFAQGTRGLYGMAAQAQDPTSIGFRVKNAVLGNGDDEDAEIAQYMDAQKFTVDSIALASGKKTIVMDRDMINHEMTQLMTYVADPTVFVPFGGLGVKAASIVGMGEKLAMASARAAAIKRGIIGGTLKWGVGAPIEFLGSATRNTIEFGLERGSQVLETATGVSAAEVKSVARLSQWGTAAASVAGAQIDPLLSTASKISLGAGTAAGVGEAIGIVGEQMLKQRELGRGILSYAGQALKDTEKSGIALSKQARGLLNVIDAADPLFSYADEITSGMAQGAVIGGALGYYAGNEEGMASGIGTGLALGGVGAGAGKVFRDVSGQTLYDRTAVQRKMVVEGLKELGHENAVSFEAMAAMAEATGDRKFQAQIDGFIAGWDKIAPDAIFKAFNEAGYGEHLNSLGIDPDTGVLREKSRVFPEVGDRGVRASVLGILRDVGGGFAGNAKGFEQAIKVEPRYQKLKKVWDKLDPVAKDAVLKQINQNGDANFVKSLKGRKLNEHFSDLAFAESATNMITDLYKKNSALVPDKIKEIIKAQTRSDKKLTRRGQMLKEKLQADGYIDREGNVRTKRLVDVEGTMGEFEGSAGWVKRRDSSGRTEVYINLDKWAKDSGDRQSLPHELYHAVMRDSVFMPDYQDRLIQKLLGKFDPQTGQRLESASVPIEQVKQFMYRYIEAQYRNETPEFINRKKKELDASVEAYKNRDSQNRVASQTETPLEHLVEEFGAYYFARWLGDKPVDFLFRGGELGGIRGLLDSAKDGWLEFWKGKMKEKNPSLDFSNPSKAITKGFEKDGKRVQVTALDLFMRDLVRMEANRNKGGAFDIRNLSQEAQAQFIKANGLRGQGFVSGDRVKRPSLRKYTAEEIRQGKEMFRILESLPDADHKGGMRKDGDGNWSGKPNTAQINALVGAGFIERAWFDRMNQAYSIVEGNGSNTIEFGYLGYSAHTGDGAERVYGAAVPFKSRKAILLSVETKVKADGTVYSNFHTLDARVIEARGNEVWKDPQVRDLWNGDRTQMEADFYAYLSNASLPSGHPNRKPSAMLLEKKDGLGGQRRDALHQMLGFHKGTDLPYINRPLAEIPIGIRHSVTTFSNDGIVNMRVENKQRVNYDHQNAHLDLSRNFMLSEMESEKTPAGGRVIRHATGYRILEGTDKKFRVVSPEGKDLGKFDKIADAGREAQKHFNETFDKSVEGKEPPAPRTEVPPSRKAFIERRNDAIFSEKQYIDKLVKALRDTKDITEKYYSDDAEVLIRQRNKFADKIESEGKISLPVENEMFEATLGNIKIDGKKDFYGFIADLAVIAGKEYDAMYPMEIKSALHGQLAQIFQDYPTITAQGLLKKLVTYGSRGSRFFQEASEIGLVDLIKSKIQKPTSFIKAEDGRIIEVNRGKESQPVLDMQEILDFAKSKEIKVTIEEGASELGGMNTENYTFAGEKSNYKQTAIRINPEYAHGVRGHYGKDTIVHFRTTERLDSEGRRVLFIEEVQTNLDKFKNQGNEKVFPMTEVKDWTLTALKGIIRQAIRDGLDKITLTHPDDSPTVSNMADTARNGLYGKIIPEVWASWLKKYGIEIVRENKLFEATVDKAKQDMAKVSTQVYESNKAVLERFEQVGQGEMPDIIRILSERLSTAVHEFKPEFAADTKDLAGQIFDQKLKENIQKTIKLKSLEHSHFQRINEAREEAGAAGVSKKDPSTPYNNDSQISAELIDRGMTFELNDRIKREFLEGRITTHAMPSESTARTGEPIPMSRYRKPMSGNVLLKVSPRLINDEIFRTNKGQSLRIAGNEKTRDGITGTERIKKQYQNNFWKNPEAAVDAAVLKFGDEKYIKGLGLERELGIDNGRHRLKAAEELGHAFIAIEVPKSQERMFDRFLVKDGTPPDGNGSRRMMPSESEQGETIRLSGKMKTINIGENQKGRTYAPRQMYEEFIGRYAEENPQIAEGLEVKYWSNDTNDLKDVDATKWHLEVIDPKSEDVVGSISFEYEQRGGFFDGTRDVDGLVVRDISVNVQPKYRGKNYQHLLYSEMFERARATGAIGFTQNIENKLGLPLKSVNKIVGKDGSKIWTLANWDPAEPTQENFDKMMAVSPKIRTGGGLLKEFVKNNGRLEPNARYQPSEFTEFSSEQSATGRILRNAKGYVIMLSNNKFRVYNPMKAIIGVYASEEEAKKRIYKDIPKQ